MSEMCACANQLQPHERLKFCPHVHSFERLIYRGIVIESRCWCGFRPIDALNEAIITGTPWDEYHLWIDYGGEG